MKRVLQLIAFISVFFLGFLALNYYIFSILGTLFVLPRNGDFYILVFTSSLLYPVAAVLERMNSNKFTNALYFIASSWLGVAFFLLWGVIIYQIISIFVDLPIMVAGGLIISISAIISFYSIFNALKMHIKEYEIPIKGINQPMHLVQLSDVHLGPIRNNSFAKKMVSQSNDLKPDAVLITGDLFDGSSNIKPDFIKTLNGFNAPTYFCPGNHDYFEGISDVLSALEKTDIHVLRDRAVELGELQLVGVDYSFRPKYLSNTLKSLELDYDRPTVLMYHLPDEFNWVAEKGIDLQLSGHTHQGQFWPFNLLVRIRFPYLGGIYKLLGSQLHVSPGTGTWGPPMRLGSRCQITLLRLVPE